VPSRFATALLWLLPAAALADAAGTPVTMWLAEGTSNRVYLLGSIHLLRERDHPLPQVIGHAYEDAETLYMELDMDDLDPLATQATITRLGMLEEEISLRDVMGEELYAEAAAAALELEIPLEMLNRTEPWYAAITVEQLMLARIGFNAAYGVEMHLLRKASGDGKEILGFETLEQQLGYGVQVTLTISNRPCWTTFPATPSSTTQSWLTAIGFGWTRSTICWTTERITWSSSGPCTWSARTVCRSCSSSAA
jgi:uncharacterized protein YbaP (TraB family)